MPTPEEKILQEPTENQIKLYARRRRIANLENAYNEMMFKANEKVEKVKKYKEEKEKKDKDKNKNK